MNAFSLTVTTLVFAVPVAFSQGLPDLVPTPNFGVGTGHCLVVDCVTVDGFDAGWTGGWHYTPREMANSIFDTPAPENDDGTTWRTQEDNGPFVSEYEPEPGILGAETDLNAEFSDSIRSLETQIATLGTHRGDSERGLAGYLVDWYGQQISAHDAYFESIAFRAGAAFEEDAVNAIAHAVISAHLAIEWSIGDALVFGELKELWAVGKNLFLNEDNTLDTHKDRLNNAVGRGIAIEIMVRGGDATDIPEAMVRAYQEGFLYIIRDDRMVPSNTPVSPK